MTQVSYVTPGPVVIKNFLLKAADVGSLIIRQIIGHLVRDSFQLNQGVPIRTNFVVHLVLSSGIN
jgi:hypothetical protein